MYIFTVLLLTRVNRLSGKTFLDFNFIDFREKQTNTEKLLRLF